MYMHVHVQCIKLQDSWRSFVWYTLGNILSAVLVSSLLPYGFELAMMAGSVFMFLGAIIVFVCLPEHPEKVGEIIIFVHNILVLSTCTYLHSIDNFVLSPSSHEGGEIIFNTVTIWGSDAICI